jgi:hypothetical protein
VSAVAPSRLLFQKPARSLAGINIVVVITGFISPPPYIGKYSIAEKAGPQEFRTLKSAGQYDDEKEKARQCAGLFLTNIFFDQLFRELCDLMRKPRDLSAGIVLMDDVALGGLHELRFRARHRLQRRIAVAALDRLFDNADGAAHLGATRLVDNGAAGNLARRLLGRGGVGHASNILRQ